MITWSLPSVRPLRFSPRAPTLLHASPHPRRHPAATRPKPGDAPRAAAGMLPERAIQQTFMWTDDWGETKRWSNEVIEAYARMLPEARFAALTRTLTLTLTRTLTRTLILTLT